MAPKEKKIKTAHCQSLLTYRRSSYPFFPSHAPSERGWSCPGGPSASLRWRWGHRASPRQVSPRLLSKRRRKGGRRGNDNNKGGERGSCPWGGRGERALAPQPPAPGNGMRGRGGGRGVRRTLGELKRCWAAEGDAGEPKSSGANPPAAPRSPAEPGTAPVRSTPAARGYPAGPRPPQGAARSKRRRWRKRREKNTKNIKRKRQEILIFLPPKLWSCTTDYSYRSSTGEG